MSYILDELIYIQNKNNGLLDPAAVVEFARDKNTLLHSKFEWDDKKAGHEYRLWQARKIIQLELYVYKENVDSNGIPVRMFFSFTDERRNGGYRKITAILSDVELREKMLQQAKEEMVVFRKKYSALKELAGVFEAMDRL